MNEPFVSIIVTARNAEQTLPRCIDSILGLDYTRYELIVVDDGSTDKTALVLKEFQSKIVLLSNPVSLGPGQSRNMAARVAKGDYIFFTDADCIVEKHWIRELLSGFAALEVVSVGGGQKVPEDETVFGRKVYCFMKKAGFISDYMRPKGPGIFFVNHNASCNVSYKRDVFLREGGFLEGLWPGEDVELDHRLKKKGFRIACNPKTVVSHYRVRQWSTFMQMMYRYGWAQGFLVARYGIFRRIQVLPFAVLALILVLGTILLKSWPVFLIATGSLLALMFIWFQLDGVVFSLGLLALVSWNIGFFKRVFFR